MCVWWWVTHIVCVFALFFFVLCTLYCRVLWIVHFSLYLRYSLAFICTSFRRKNFKLIDWQKLIMTPTCTEECLQFNATWLIFHPYHAEMLFLTRRRRYSLCLITRSVRLAGFYCHSISGLFKYNTTSLFSILLFIWLSYYLGPF